MKRAIPAFLALALFASSLPAQVKAVHFKKLQECLPSGELKGFKKEKPSGTTQTAMGMTTSEAGVRYTSLTHDTTETGDALSPVTLEVKISDMVMMPYALMQFSMQQDFENETEDGHEKSVKVLDKYAGREQVKTGESKSCEISFGVANRFLVTAEGSSTDDAALVMKLVSMMDLAKLEALAKQ